MRADDRGWREEAACRGVDPDVMYPVDGAGVPAAKAVCRECEVREACLDFAIDNREDHGVWGGLSERERRSLRKKGRASVPIPHGTATGYRRGCREACCREAHARDKAAREREQRQASGWACRRAS